MAPSTLQNEITSADHKDTTPMEEAFQGDSERIGELYGRLMALEIPSFVIRSSIDESQIKGVFDAMGSGSTYKFAEALQPLHTQALEHIETHSDSPYEPMEIYKGKAVADVQINTVSRERPSDPHYDNPTGRDSTHPPTIVLHTVVDGTADVEMTGYNHPVAETDRGTLDIQPHHASLTEGDSVVFRAGGKKPSHHAFRTTSENIRTSAIQNVHPSESH